MTLASSYGIHSVAAAVVFALLYVPLLLLFIRQSISRPTYVYIVIAFFCLMRITAFIMRAALAGVASDGQDLNLLIAYGILYNVGFFGLLYSAYTLVLDCGRLSEMPLPNGRVSRLVRRPEIFRLALIAAVALGITGAVQSSTGSTESIRENGNALHDVAIYIFFVLCILLAIQTVALVYGMVAYTTHKRRSGGFGARYSICILCAISLLLLTRETFFVVTSSDAAKQNDERVWYPLSALTEFVAVVMFAAPGLVPSRDELSSE